MGNLPTRPALKVAYFASAIAIIALASAVAYESAPKPAGHAQHHSAPIYP